MGVVGAIDLEERASICEQLATIDAASRATKVEAEKGLGIRHVVGTMLVDEAVTAPDVATLIAEGLLF